MDPLLPRRLPLSLAAVIAGRSRRGFERDCFAFCATEDGSAVSTEKLEKLVGIELSGPIYLAADRRLDPERDRARTRMRKEAL